MKEPAIPANESERQQVLDALDIIYSPAEERFNRITRIAQRLFGTPIALISLVTEDKQWFKSCQGLTTSETSREISFCGHAIHQEDAFVVPNAAHDPDFRDNPLVTGEPHIRFYAGQPLSIDGQRIGTLCVIDKKPRQLKPRDYDSLRCLANWVESEILFWKTNKGSLIKEALSIENREAYFDDVTGNLSTNVLEKLQAGISRLKSTGADVRGLEIEVYGLPASDEPESQQMSIKKVSQALHQILNDEGLIAFDGERTFTLLQFVKVGGDSDLPAVYTSALKEEFSDDPSLVFNITSIEDGH